MMDEDDKNEGFEEISENDASDCALPRIKKGQSEKKGSKALQDALKAVENIGPKGKVH